MKKSIATLLTTTALLASPLAAAEINFGFNQSYKDAQQAKYMTFYNAAKQIKATKRFHKVTVGNESILWEFAVDNHSASKLFWGAEFLAPGEPLLYSGTSNSSVEDIAYVNGFDTTEEFFTEVVLNADEDGLDKLGVSREQVAEGFYAQDAGFLAEAIMASTLPIAVVIADNTPTPEEILAWRMKEHFDSLSPANRLALTLGRFDDMHGLTEEFFTDISPTLLPDDIDAWVKGAGSVYVTSADAEIFKGVIAYVEEHASSVVKQRLDALNVTANNLRADLEAETAAREAAVAAEAEARAASDAAIVASLEEAKAEVTEFINEAIMVQAAIDAAQTAVFEAELSALQTKINEDVAEVKQAIIDGDNGLAADLQTAIDDAAEKRGELRVALQANIDAEQARAEAAEKVNADAIIAEVANRVAADSEIAADLSTEVARAMAEEMRLVGLISDEMMARVAANDMLQDNIDAEQMRAEAAELVLTNDLASEVERAEAAELVLTNDLAAEVVARGLDVDAEEARALAAELVLTNDLASEVARAEAAELVLTNDLAAEVTARGLDVDAEEVRAMAAEGVLSGRITTLETAGYGQASDITDNATEIAAVKVTAEAAQTANEVSSAIDTALSGITSGAISDNTAGITANTTEIAAVKLIAQAAQTAMQVADSIASALSGITSGAIATNTTNISNNTSAISDNAEAIDTKQDILTAAQIASFTADNDTMYNDTAVKADIASNAAAINTKQDILTAAQIASFTADNDTTYDDTSIQAAIQAVIDGSNADPVTVTTDAELLLAGWTQPSSTEYRFTKADGTVVRVVWQGHLYHWQVVGSNLLYSDAVDALSNPLLSGEGALIVVTAKEDREAIREEFAAADAQLQTNISSVQTAVDNLKVTVDSNKLTLDGLNSVYATIDSLSLATADIATNVTAIALNTAKVGITTAQAADITANNAKVGITTDQSSAIVANTAKVGITTDQSSAIVANTAKVGITTGQAAAIVANTAKVGISVAQAAAISANTAKVGISVAQATAISTNTAAIATLVEDGGTIDTKISEAVAEATTIVDDGGSYDGSSVVDAIKDIDDRLNAGGL